MWPCRCHKTKLELNKGPCPGCLAGGMRARGAMIGHATNDKMIKIRRFLTMDSDYLEYPAWYPGPVYV